MTICTVVEVARARLWLGDAGSTDAESLVRNAGLRPPATEAERLMLLGIVTDLHIKAVEHRGTGDKLLAVVAYVRAHARSGRVTRATTAKATGVSDSWIAHAFQKALGVSFSHFVTERRLTTACDLLQSTETSIKEIALTTGFRSAGAFTSVFTRRFGTSPSAWRRTRQAGDGNPWS